jgi:hypothetical protein
MHRPGETQIDPRSMIEGIGSRQHHPAARGIAQAKLGVVTRRMRLDREDLLASTACSAHRQSDFLNDVGAARVHAPQSQHGDRLGAAANELGNRRDQVAAAEAPKCA